ncbi:MULTISPECIES: alpha-keto acid decarboxylase family protein [Nostoc]|uniref:Alpha-keto-acid decarboxylase n=1 Tax=Nostoc paludosum FACHB-159 TaxID=2692908 RepID=A0ABR8K435_9NOSO|nr:MULTISPECIES: thiamine pyrophosphate-binding protein [Nostoc]MBD2677400.1 thiamine pyrophosphate-binding protein [Nostoc sp. FACHB-857]MBD2734207.1 thiamine pyrophosphate-binding protein [Nostoc paludosum FACHB-159]
MPQLAPHIFDILYEKGVEHAFGIPGDFALTLFDALADSKIAPIVMTHEPCVGFAADAYSRMRGLGLAVVTYSVGGLNMVNAVAGAYAEKSPLVILSGGPGVREQREHDLLHHKVKTFDTQRRVYEEVTLYATKLTDPKTADAQIHLALDYATTFKRPVYLEIPRDLVYAEITESEHLPPPIKRTDPDTLMEAIAETLEMLKRSHSPVILACVEIHRFGLQEQLLALAEKLGVPVCSTMLGKSVFPEGHPQYIGIYNGEAGDLNVQKIVEESDCVLMLGVFMTDINLGMFTAHLNPSCTVYATSERIAIKHHEYPNVRFEDFITALLDSPDLPHWDSSGIYTMKPRVTPSVGKISMSGLLYELNQFIDSNTLLVTDVGDTLFAADDIQTQQGTSFLCPAFYASMGFGVPGVIGAQLADPSRRAIALVGDGAFQMTGMELLTAQRLRLNPIVIVINNGSFASLQAMGHQEAAFVQIPTMDYAQLANILGGHGFVIYTSTQLQQALHTAQNSRTFSILDVHLSPNDVSPALQRLSALFTKSLTG